MHQPHIDALSAALNLQHKGLAHSVETSDFNESLTAKMEKLTPMYKGA